jgi:hypothetical protein
MNLTLSIDEETLKRARMRAVTEDTSVNAVVRDFLETYASGWQERREAMDRILSLALNSTAGSGPKGRTWTREDAYDREVLR